jgi:hypothetical protein
MPLLIVTYLLHVVLLVDTTLAIMQHYTLCNPFLENLETHRDFRNVMQVIDARRGSKLHPMRRVHGATSLLFATSFKFRATFLSFFAQQHSFLSLTREHSCTHISATKTSLSEVFTSRKYGVPLVSIILEGVGVGSCHMGKSYADRYGRYQAKLKTAPLLTQAITTGVSIPPKYCRPRNASSNTLIERLDCTINTRLQQCKSEEVAEHGLMFYCA